MNSDITNQILPLLSQLSVLIARFADNTKDTSAAPAAKAPVEMLTIKECTEQFHGLTSYTLRKLVSQGKVQYTRAGEGVRGKILINKDSLINYLQNNN
ncbi:MAG: helix-turn-helix domain-containing protein [Oscillospiraceae bacterium]|nr:helix-turn-helix domain-containing protein [Oscillospiraceae bacterium]